MGCCVSQQNNDDVQHIQQRPNNRGDVDDESDLSVVPNPKQRKGNLQSPNEMSLGSERTDPTIVDGDVELTVETMDDQKYVVRCYHSTTIHHIKRLLMKETTLPPWQQRLVHDNGVMMSCTEPLQTYSFHKKVKLRLVRDFQSFTLAANMCSKCTEENAESCSAL